MSIYERLILEFHSIDFTGVQKIVTALSGRNLPHILAEPVQVNHLQMFVMKHPTQFDIGRKLAHELLEENRVEKMTLHFHHI